MSSICQASDQNEDAIETVSNALVNGKESTNNANVSLCQWTYENRFLPVASK